MRAFLFLRHACTRGRLYDLNACLKLLGHFTLPARYAPYIAGISVASPSLRVGAFTPALSVVQKFGIGRQFGGPYRPRPTMDI